MGNKTRLNARIKLHDKQLNKLKLSVENLVVEHGGSYIDNQAGAAVKPRYTRVVEVGALDFTYPYHGTISEYRAYNNAKSQLNTHLKKLDIVERLPSLLVRSTATYDSDMLAARKGNPIGLAFIAYEEAWSEIEELLDIDDINDIKDINDG